MDVSMHAQVRSYVTQRLRMHGDIVPVGDDDPLFTSGRLDSLDAVELITVLESDHDIDFARMSFDLRLLDSVTAITKLVSRAA